MSAAFRSPSAIRSLIRNLSLVCLVALLAGCALSGQSGHDPTQPFTLVVMPDTQNYADIRNREKTPTEKREASHAIFYEQTEWIRDHAREKNIVMVAHVGDVTQTDFPAEWDVADRAFQTLDDAGIPYTITLGNHDMGYGPNPKNPQSKITAVTRDTLFNDYFPPARFADRPWYGGHMGTSNDNNYVFFQGGGEDFLLISLEFKPRPEALEWADRILRRYPNHKTIISTHAYLLPDNQRQADLNYYVDGLSGEAIWDQLIRRHDQILAVICGHHFGEGRLVSLTDGGKPVMQMLADYQHLEKGGNGYLRLLRFDPATRTVDVQTLSTHTGETMDGETSRFSFAY